MIFFFFSFFFYFFFFSRFSQLLCFYYIKNLFVPISWLLFVAMFVNFLYINPPTKVQKLGSATAWTTWLRKFITAYVGPTLIEEGKAIKLIFF
jgi:hypothetical protein